MKLELDLPLEGWQIVSELLVTYKSSIGIWLTEIDPYDVICEVEEAVQKLEGAQTVDV